jgi:hypothetical protein
MTLRDHVRLAINQLISFVLSTVFLLGVVIWAFTAEALYSIPNFFKWSPDPKYAWDDDKYWRREGKKVTKEPADYAHQVGLDIENQTVETEDGYLLRMHRVVDPNAQPRSDGRGEYLSLCWPILTSRWLSYSHPPRSLPVVRLLYHLRRPLPGILAC